MMDSRQWYRCSLNAGSRKIIRPSDLKEGTLFAEHYIAVEIVVEQKCVLINVENSVIIIFKFGCLRCDPHKRGGAEISTAFVMRLFWTIEMQSEEFINIQHWRNRFYDTDDDIRNISYKIGFSKTYFLIPFWIFRPVQFIHSGFPKYSLKE